MATEWIIDLIEDPLAWQAMMDNAPSSINMRGSARFWSTVESMGLEVVYRDGAPEFNEIVFRLQGNIGLRLWAEEIVPSDFEPDDDVPIRPHIKFAFCAIEDTDDYDEQIPRRTNTP